MTITIHHSTVKKAEAAGIDLDVIGEEGEEQVAAFDAEGTELATGTDPKEVVTQAIAALEQQEEEPAEPEAEEAEEAEEEEQVYRGSVVPMKYRERYKQNGDPDCCGDDMSQILKSFCKSTNEKGKEVVDPQALEEVARDNGIDLARWENLNIGMVRMNLGNVLRGKLGQGHEVKIGNTVIKPEGAEDDE